MRNTTMSRWALGCVLAVLFSTANAVARDTLPIDGMVGQVNGKAIYAASVFETIEAQLLAKGRTEPLPQFQQSAHNAIAGQLNRIVLNKLMLAEAERDLSAEEERYLKIALQKKLEDMMRELGSSSRIAAEQEARRKYQMTLDEKLNEHREEILLRRYYAREIWPKIVIRRKDVERYYRENTAQFNSPEKRKVHMIVTRATDEDIIAQVQEKLDAGTPFLEVASDRNLNNQRPAEQGLFNAEHVGNRLIADDADNDKVMALASGEYAGPFKQGPNMLWVYIAEIHEGRNIPFREAQLTIERILREEEFTYLMTQLRQDAFRKGNYTDLNEMADKLVAVAVTRYYKPEEETSARRP